MRIQHNITALNAYRNYSNNTSAVSKNLEKLSSGYKINRAGDDAAGLAVSEKMRAQITGLQAAQKNAKDGISLVQTGEGALTEVHSMLNRMYELANLSANGTYDDPVDRANYQKEMDSLKSEIDRIADSTNFNGIKLLDGSLSASDEVAAEKQMMTIGGSALTAGQFVDAKGATTTFSGSNLKATVNFDAYVISFTDKDGNNHKLSLVESKGDQVGADIDQLISALNGDGKLDLAPNATGDQDAALKAFHETFKASKDSTDIVFEVKDPAGKGQLSGVAYGSNATSSKEALDAAAALASKSATGATKAGYEVTLGNLNTVGETFSIGGKTYEMVNAAGDAVNTAGATAVVKADAAANVTNILAALKADGYAVETTGDGKLLFTDPTQLQENQAGAQVSSTASGLNIADQKAVKQSTTITVGAQAMAASTLTVNYVDANGKAQSKQLSYTGGNNASSDTTLIANLLKDDAELSELFDIAVAPGGDITITAKGTDTAVGQFGSISTSNGSGISAVAITAGKEDGKTVGLKNGVSNLAAGDTITVNGKTYEFASDTSAAIGKGNTRVLLGTTGADSLKNLSAALDKDGIRHNVAADGTITLADKDNVAQNKKGLTLQIGDTSESFNQMTVSVGDMHAAALGIGGIDISTQEGAAAATDLIKAAINSVSSTRGDLGALQNRLEHTINNLSVAEENIQNAESAIRDVDVAKEMMAYTKNNILVQSAQAMLAQANQLPQGVLQLMQ